MDRIDAVVIGAGVVGLAVARALAARGDAVVVIERHDRTGSETSSRNSGVIHSGIYYPTDSAKARLSVRGRGLLYEYCRSRHIPHRQCGKLIVAQSTETAKLEALARQARSNGVGNLQWLDAAGVQTREPEVRAAAGLWCPDTGIVSVHELLTTLQGDLESDGGSVALKTNFLEAQAGVGGFRLSLICAGEPLSLECDRLVNCAGLDAVAVLGRIDGYPRARVPTPYFAKGNYFEFSGKAPFSSLVYPMPNEAGLGVHATLDLGNRVRFGPDVEWIQPEGGELRYTVDAGRVEAFYDAIRTYWPGLPDAGLRPSYCGIRPKLVGPGLPAADFLIEGPPEHGVAGLVNLLGIESPGLTSSLALAEEVVKRLDMQ